MPFKKIYLSWTMLFLGVFSFVADAVLAAPALSPSAAAKSIPPAFGEMQILNETVDRSSRMYLLDNVQVPVAGSAPTGETLQGDLDRYLKGRVALDPGASRRLTATIKKAEAYWVLPLDEKAALDGFDLQDRRPAEREFVLELQVSFEVREAGLVTGGWLFARKVLLPDGRVEFPGEVRESYGRLLDRSRKILFEALEREFLAGLH
jgi:hypothetical protein